jgi:myb proto-oncogene protein
MTKNNKRASFRKWTEQEDTILINWIKENGPKMWSNCCVLFKDRSATQCRERWKNSLDPKIKKGDWSEREDLKLFNAIKKNLFSWKKVSLELEGRTRISCRNRYYNSIKNLNSTGFGGVFKQLIIDEHISDYCKSF